MDEFVKSEGIGRSSMDAILDMVTQQKKIMNLYKIDTFKNVTAVMATSTALTKMMNIAMPKYSIPAKSVAYASIMSAIPKETGQINKMHSALGLSNIDILVRQMTPKSLGVIQDTFSPTLQIQKSLSSLYSTKSAFANYSNLYSNAAFWSQFKELQNVISEFPKKMTSASFDTDYDSDEELYINEVLSETSAITANIDKTKIVSFDDFEQLKSKIDAIYTFLISSQKTKHGKLLTFVIFLLFTIEPLLNDIVQQVQHYQDSQTNVSKDDIKDLSDKLQQSMEEMRSLIVKYDYRFAKYDCLLKIKNNTNTTTIYKIKKGDNLMVLQVKKKWLLVLIEDRTDNSQITGWVLKKYISKQHVGKVL
jgi:hypothetical protein